jgi:hypothetical protein
MNPEITLGGGSQALERGTEALKRRQRDRQTNNDGVTHFGGGDQDTVEFSSCCAIRSA